MVAHHGVGAACALAVRHACRPAHASSVVARAGPLPWHPLPCSVSQDIWMSPTQISQKEERMLPSMAAVRRGGHAGCSCSMSSGGAHAGSAAEPLCELPNPRCAWTWHWSRMWLCCPSLARCQSCSALPAAVPLNLQAPCRLTVAPCWACLASCLQDAGDGYYLFCCAVQAQLEELWALAVQLANQVAHATAGEWAHVRRANVKERAPPLHRHANFSRALAAISVWQSAW